MFKRKSRLQGMTIKLENAVDQNKGKLLFIVGLLLGGYLKPHVTSFAKNHNVYPYLVKNKRSA